MTDASTTTVVCGWLPQPIGGFTVVQQGFFDSFFGFVSHDTSERKVFGGYIHVGTGYIASARDTLCKKFLDTQAEWLLMIDWDITFPPDAVYALLDAADPMERPIIAGCYVTYFGNESALRPCWMHERDGQEFVPPDEFHLGQIVECSTVGMGFTLIHRSVLEALEKVDSGDPQKFFGHDIIGNDRVGEDITFCNRARKAGFSVWGHGGVLLGHTKSKTLVVSDIMDPTMARPMSVEVPTKMEPRTTGRVLNVGGGSKAIPLPDDYDGWSHVLLDINEGTDVDLVMDAREVATSEKVNLWVPFDAVFCSHNLEHYHSHDVPKVLAGFLRVLKKGGRVDIRVPDLSQVAQALSEGHGIDDVAYVSSAGPILYRDMIFGYGREIESSGNDFYAHKTGFTPERLGQVLTDAGFIEVDVQSSPGAFELRATALKGVD